MPDTRNPLFARLWAFAMARAQPREVVDHRRRTLAGLTGRVLELGAGAGSNFGLYPPEVDDVLAVEPEPYLRRQATRAARDATVDVRVLDGDAGALPAEDGSCDAAVACMVLCSVPDQAAALAELHRVLRPGGTLRFFEHVAAGGERPVMDRVQRACDATFWPRAFGGCHTHRDTAAAIEAAGFRTVERERFDLGRIGRVLPAGSHLLGTAVRD